MDATDEAKQLVGLHEPPVKSAAFRGGCENVADMVESQHGSARTPESGRAGSIQYLRTAGKEQRNLIGKCICHVRLHGMTGACSTVPPHAHAKMCVCLLPHAGDNGWAEHQLRSASWQ